MNRKEILAEVEADMKALYTNMSKKLLDRADADSFANIAGKRLKAVQLDLADDIFVSVDFHHATRKLGLRSVLSYGVLAAPPVVHSGAGNACTPPRRDYY